MKQTTYNLHIHNIERREALKTFTDLGLVSIAGSLGLLYVWNNHKDSSVIESSLANHEVIKHSIHTESKPYFMLYPRTTLLLSSSLVYNPSYLFTLLKLNTSFIILLDSLHTPLLETLQDIKDNLEYINERYIYKDIESKLDSIIQSLQHNNELFYIHNQALLHKSIGGYIRDSDTSLQVFIQTLRNLINDKVNIDKIGEKAGKIVKEAYAKLWFYLDMRENKQLEAYLRNEVQVDPKYYTLDNITSQAYIQTKLKITQDKANQSFAENNKEENFITMEGNAKGKIRFNRDFLIQLKRVAEWNYRVYEEKEVLLQPQNEESHIRASSTKEPSPDEWLGGNLIYVKDYIPTTIDIKD